MSQYNDTDRLNWIESVGGDFWWGLEQNESNEPEYVGYFKYRTQVKASTFKDLIDAAIVLDAEHKVAAIEHNEKQREKGVLWPSYKPERDEPKWRVLYQVTGGENARHDEDGNVLYGVKLTRISMDGPYDVAHDHITEGGEYGHTYFADTINIGDIFTPRATNFSRDWESGTIDGWDVEFSKTEILPGDTLYK